MIFAVVTALCFGLNSIVVKNLTERGWGETALVWLNFAVGLVPLVLLAAGLGSWDRFAPEFWWALPCGVIGNMIVVTLLYRAIRLTRVSIVLPLVALSPIYMPVTSRLMVGQEIPMIGFSGIGLVVAGAYLLGSAEAGTGLFAPFRALWKDKGARIALAVSVLWSITANFDKIAITASDPLTYVALFTFGMTIGYLPFFHRRRCAVREKSLWRGSLVPLLALGLTYATMAAAHMMALESLAVPYVIAIKRAGVLIAVIFDLARGERGMIRTGAGGVLTLAGIAVIVLTA